MPSSLAVCEGRPQNPGDLDFNLQRLFISEPTPMKLKILPFRHALYHACANDSHCIAADGMPMGALMVQHKAYENSSCCLQLVGGR